MLISEIFGLPEGILENRKLKTAPAHMGEPGSLRPLRTVRATFTAYGSGTFKADPAKGNPADITFFYLT